MNPIFSLPQPSEGTTTEEAVVGSMNLGTLGTMAYAAQEALASSVTTMGADWIGRKVNELSAASSGRTKESPDYLNKKYGMPGLEFKEPMYEETAHALYTLRREREEREEFLRHSSGGLASLAGGFAGGAVDPINLASALVPVVGEAKAALMLAKISKSIKNVRMARVATSAAVGAIEGSVGQALLEPAMYGLTRSEMRDYTFYDTAANITFGAALGGGLGAVVSGVAELAAKASPTTAPHNVDNTAKAQGEAAKFSEKAKQEASIRAIQKEKALENYAETARQNPNENVALAVTAVELDGLPPSVVPKVVAAQPVNLLNALFESREGQEILDGIVERGTPPQKAIPSLQELLDLRQGTPLVDVFAEHKALVEQALTAGERVPAEILKEYPDLLMKHSDHPSAKPAFKRATDHVERKLLEAEEDIRKTIAESEAPRPLESPVEKPSRGGRKAILAEKEASPSTKQDPQNPENTAKTEEPKDLYDVTRSAKTKSVIDETDSIADSIIEMEESVLQELKGSSAERGILDTLNKAKEKIQKAEKAASALASAVGCLVRPRL